MSAPHFCRGFQKDQRQRVRDGDDESVCLFRRCDFFGKVSVDSERVRPWHDERGGLIVDVFAVNRQTQRLGSGVDDVHGLRMQGACDHDAIALAFVVAHGDADGFSGGGGFVE